MNSAVFSLTSALIVSLVSFVGLGLFAFKLPSLSRFTVIMVSFAVGSLLGDAFIHLLPEAFETINPPILTSLLSVSGLLLFFSIEKVLRWRHCHDPDCEGDSHGHVIAINLVGDTVHNFMDGMLIAASYLTDTKLGLATTLAVFIHEIPQEIGDFGIFLHHGMTVRQALRLNFLSALSSLLGVIAIFILGSGLTGISDYLLPVTAGGFIYLAASDLIPELHQHHHSLISASLQLLFIVLGVALMSLLLLLE